MLIIFTILIVLMSVVIHEVSHGYAAYLQGDPTAKLQGRLTLNPIAHLDPIGSIVLPILTAFGGFPIGYAKPVPFNPYNLRSQRWGEFFVAIAGPLSNLLIALFFGLIVRFMPFFSIKFMALLLEVAIINIGLALFNLLPVIPLDGSRIIFSLLPYRWSRFRWNMERYSLAFVILILLLATQVTAFNEVLNWAVLSVTHYFSGLSYQDLFTYLNSLG